MQHTYYQVGTYTRTRAHFLCHHLLTLSRPARPARPPPHLPTTPTFCRPQVLTDEDDSKEFPRVGLGTQTWTPQQGVVLNVDLVAHDDIEPYTPFLPSPFAPAVGDEDLSVLSHPLMDTLFELTPAGAAVPSVETTRSYNSNNSNSNNSNSNSNSNISGNSNSRVALQTHMLSHQQDHLLHPSAMGIAQPDRQPQPLQQQQLQPPMLLLQTPPCIQAHTTEHLQLRLRTQLHK